MLVDRGPRVAPKGLGRPCYFLDKAWHAQLAGADALLVVNDNPGDLSTAVAPDDEDSSREAQDLTISAGLISQRDGDTLKALLSKGPVTVALNWTDLLPKKHKVEWEFFTNSNDECGPTCDTQRLFIKSFKATGKLLQIKGLVDFQPHYLIWVCQEGSSKAVCDSQCIRGGAYCCPDPDDNIKEGYSGVDVLKMNIRSLCFARVARDRGEPWLWWDYVDRLGDDCRMKDGLYTTDCAQKVFDAVAGSNIGGPEGRKLWAECIDLGPAGAQGPIPLLESELKVQTGGGDGGAAATVAILPTVRINRKQYRGNLDAGSVLRALCAAFPYGSEPGVCTETWVSEDECEVGGDGWRACNSGANSTLGLTRCINTFKGFKCECGAGYMRVNDKVTGEESCAEVNECLASSVPWTREECKCARCVCTHTAGGFNCSGPIPDYCTPELDYAGCWRASYNGKQYHACHDNMRMYRYLAQYGRLNASTKPFQCQCPPCFRATADGFGCEPACDLETQCDVRLGACLLQRAAAAALAAGGGGDGGRAEAGIGILSAFLGMLAASAASAAAVYAFHHGVMRRRMREDMRDMLEEYAPLAGGAPPSDQPGAAPGPGTGTAAGALGRPSIGGYGYSYGSGGGGAAAGAVRFPPLPPASSSSGRSDPGSPAARDDRSDRSAANSRVSCASLEIER